MVMGDNVVILGSFRILFYMCFCLYFKKKKCACFVWGEKCWFFFFSGAVSGIKYEFSKCLQNDFVIMLLQDSESPPFDSTLPNVCYPRNVWLMYWRDYTLQEDTLKVFIGSHSVAALNSSYNHSHSSPSSESEKNWNQANHSGFALAAVLK